jgi:hypothetical protein
VRACVAAGCRAQCGGRCGRRCGGAGAAARPPTQLF